MIVSLEKAVSFYKNYHKGKRKSYLLSELMEVATEKEHFPLKVPLRVDR